MAVKALACELPHEHGLPLSRLSIPEIRREAIRPWAHRSWIFPRDPAFEQKAARVLDLYEGRWEGKPLAAADCVLSTDEKTSIQARKRIHRSMPPAPGRAMRVEHEYQRMGAWAYFAAWDVRRAKIHGRCERKTGIVPFGRLVEQVMSQEPYRSAPRVFWIMDNGSSHRGERCAVRLRERWPTIVAVHTPVHASWLNQVEIYFSVVQRKALTPNNFASLGDLEDRLLGFERRYEAVAQPFEWNFTRRDLRKLMEKLRERERPLAAAA